MIEALNLRKQFGSVTAVDSVSFRAADASARPPSRPAATTAAYLDYSINTCQRRHAAIAGASVLYVAIMTFDLAWIYRARSTPPGAGAFLTSPLVLAVGVLSIALAAVAFWRRRRLERELKNLLDLRRQFAASGGE